MTDEIKRNVYYALVNYEVNREALKEIPHERFLDLAVVLYVNTDTGERNYCSMLISAPLLKIWQIDFSELYDAAKKNTVEKRQVQVFNLREILYETMQSYMRTEQEKNSGGNKLEDFFAILVEEIVKKRGFPEETVAVTNSAYRFGAACILYPGMLKSIAGERWEKLLILPCSVHEVSVVPYVSEEEADRLKECVAEIGKMDKGNSDFLSGSLYVYDAVKDEISIYQ